MFLCNLVGSNGNVISFDIQDIAIENTEKLLKESNLEGVARLYKTSHENMPDYAEKESISAIMFNLGYLPKGDHKISTKSESTINAISKGLDLLKPCGVMSICIYSGKDSGFEEKENVLSYLKQLDKNKYQVIVNQFYNRPNNPPIPVFIIRC